jgi:hypothetical protein
MEAVALQTHLGMPVSIDACWPCQLIWFDQLESTSLSPGSVIELFKRIHAVRDVPRHLVRMQTQCPICSTALLNTSDIAKGGRFAYSRCGSGHGRLIAFTQFLREKNFIRSLQPHEIATLSVKVKQIRCSSCGGSINLENDKACVHCGSAISVLDEAAVEKALATLQKKETERISPTPERMADALLAAEESARRARHMPVNAGSQYGVLESVLVGGGLVDLVQMGVGAALAAWFDD